MARENNKAAATRASAADPADTAVSDTAGAPPDTAAPDTTVVLASGADQPAGAVEAEGETPPAEIGRYLSTVIPEFAAHLKDAQAEKWGTLPEGSELRLPDLEVTATVHSRRRAGRRFGLMPVIIPAGEATDQLLTALDSDPFLKVRLVPFQAAERDEA